MSQLDLIAEIRKSRPIAPDELRGHVRRLAASAPAPQRRVTWRRALFVAVAVGAMAVVAAVVIPLDGKKSSLLQPNGRAPELRSGRAPSTEAADQVLVAPTYSEATGTSKAQHTLSKPVSAAPAPKTLTSGVPPPSGTNAQKYSATLSLRLKNANEVSAATNKALKITAALGGHPNTVSVDAERKAGEAYLVLKVPRSRVQEAVQKLGALGTIVGANVSIQDLQAGIDTTGRTIDRLKDNLTDLRATVQTEDVVAQIESLEGRIENLQRQRAATIRAAYFATVKLHMETREAAAPVAEEDGNGPLHGLGVAFRWIGIGAIYALALGTPLVLLVALGWFLARILRRRREEALLARA